MATMMPLGSTDPEPIEVVASARTTLLHATPLARLATPDDVAAAAVFLASSESSYITGVVLPVDSDHTGHLDPTITVTTGNRPRVSA